MCHSLNLVVVDSAKLSAKILTYFGILIRLYTIFSLFTKSWSNIKANVWLSNLNQLGKLHQLNQITSILLGRCIEGLWITGRVLSREEEWNNSHGISYIDSANHIREFYFVDYHLIWHSFIKLTKLAKQSDPVVSHWMSWRINAN